MKWDFLKKFKIKKQSSIDGMGGDSVATEKEASMRRGLIYGAGGAAILLLVVLGFVFSSSLKNLLPSFGKPGTETARLKMVVVTKKDCKDCFDVNLLVDTLQQIGNVKIVGQKTVYIDDAVGKKLVDQYKIEKVPTVLITGDLDKVNTEYQKISGDTRNLWSFLGEVVDKTFVWRQVIPPYVDVKTGTLKGVVSVTYLKDASCSDCYDVTMHGNALKNLGINTANAKVIDVASDEGKALVKQYNIQLVPTVVIQGEVDQYQSIVQLWKTYGKVADDGTYIFTKVDEMGTYRNLATGKVTKVSLP